MRRKKRVVVLRIATAGIRWPCSRRPPHRRSHCRATTPQAGNARVRIGSQSPDDREFARSTSRAAARRAVFSQGQGVTSAESWIRGLDESGRLAYPRLIRDRR